MRIADESGAPQRAAPRGPVAALFTRTPTGYVYREGGCGPAIPLTEAEGRRFQSRIWLGLGLVLVAYMGLMIGGAVLFSNLLGDRFAVVGPVVMALALLSLTYLAVRWVMSAPSRATRGREPVAPPIDADEMRRRRLGILRQADTRGIGIGFILATLWLATESIWYPAVGVPCGLLVIGWGWWSKRRSAAA